MSLIASKHLNQWKKPKQLGTKSKRLSMRKRQVSTNKCINQKTEMLYGKSYT